jgi:hypothetical protein
MNGLSVAAAALLALGIAGAGYFLREGIIRHNQTSNVSVKGLAEREVPASLAIWTISYSATGDQLQDLNARLRESSLAVQDFLKQTGFDAADVALQPPSIRDHHMEVRSKDSEPPPQRYSAAQSILVRTTKVDQVKPAVAALSGLMERGVALSGNNDPRFFFNELNDIKPGMIEEATRNARIAAEQFARDSQTQLGKLRNASQGRFEVDDRDAATPERKTVRVVVEVVYDLD